MKSITALKTLLVVFSVATSLSEPCAQMLVAGWDFQTTNVATGGGQIVASPNTATLIPSNFGTGYLFLDGTNGSSAFLPVSNEIATSSGVNWNIVTGDGFSTVTTAPASLLIAHKTSASPANETNGKSIVYKFSMTGYDYMDISYGLFRHGTATDNTSFTKTSWAFSSDGSSWTAIEDIDISTLYNATTFYGSKFYTIPSNASHLPALANATTAYLKMTVDGATGITAYSNIRLDNIKIKAAKAFSVTPTITFPVTTVSKNVGDPSFTEKATSNSAGAITYSSDNTAVATVDASTGEVVILGNGVANITATQAQSTMYAAGTKSYILTVGASAVSNTTVNQVIVYPKNGIIIIESETVSPFEIISINGQVIAKGMTIVGKNKITVATKGLLLVRVDGKTAKIIKQ
ncbi:MAG: hypothetical protein WCJ61_01010 [Paludibacter sp.]|jgi:hypothetical protein